MRFIFLPGAWAAIARQTINIGEYLTDAVRAAGRENPKLYGVFENLDFNTQYAGQPVIDNDRFFSLVQILSQHRLGLKDVEADILGRAYEYLLRKFAEGQGQSAGEFYTPREVTWLMAYLLEPQPGDEIYDPACGSGGLLIKSVLAFKEAFGDDPRIEPVKIYGQEILYTTFALAKMNAFIHDLEADIRLGDTITWPLFTNPDGSLCTFDKVTANPMWNQKYAVAVYENDSFERFNDGIPPTSSADWGWIQHMFASLKEGGKMAVVLDTGAVSRGSGTQGANRERDIRKAFVENDLVECVILLPENMFYNTTAPGIIMVINDAKKHPGEILLINAGKLFTKGRPKNFLAKDHIEKIAGLYREWQKEEELSAIIPIEEAIRNDYNLSPSRYVTNNGKVEYLPVEEIMVELAQVEKERQAIDQELNDILDKLGFGGWLHEQGS